MVGDGAKGRAVGVGRGSQMLRGPKVVVPATFDRKLWCPQLLTPATFAPKVVVPATFDPHPRKLWCPQLLTESCGARNF